MAKSISVDSCSDCPFINYDGKDSWCTRNRVMNKISDETEIPKWCPLDHCKSEFPEGTVLSLSDDRIISLYNKDGGKAGEIRFGDKNIKFSGEFDKSADSLFSLLKYVIDYFQKG